MTLDSSDLALQERLAAGTRFARFVHLASCSSTQDVALQESGSVCVWADEQTEGRGRRGRPWHGAPLQDCEMTLRIEGLALDRPELLAPAVPCGVVLALESLCGSPLTLKWPNDVLHHGRKVCGILIDAHGGREPTFLIGIGVNLNRSRFPGELVEHAASLGSIVGRNIDRHETVARLSASVDRVLDTLAEGRTAELDDVFRSRIALAGRRAVVRPIGEAEREGVVTSLDLRQVGLDGVEYPLTRIEVLRPA